MRLHCLRLLLPEVRQDHTLYWDAWQKGRSISAQRDKVWQHYFNVHIGKDMIFPDEKLFIFFGSR
jgi:hypothetical protein